MKIGLITHRYPVDEAGAPCAAGGIASYTRTVAEHLAAMGHDTHVFTLGSGTRHACQTHQGVHIWRCPLWAYRRQMPMRHAAEFTWRYRNEAYRLNSYTMMLGVRRAARPGPFDVIETPDLGALGELLERPRHTRRLALRLHTPSAYKAFANGNPDARNGEMNRRERALYETADVVTSPTASAVELIEEFWSTTRDDVRVVGNPTFTYDHQREPAQRQPSIVYFGQLEQIKGVDVLADALPRIAERMPGVKARLIGEDCGWPDGRPAAEVIAERCGDLLEAGMLTIHPPMGGRPLFEAVAEASVCVLPSRRETFGLTFVEAMMLGQACVVSDIPAFQELARDADQCVFFKSGDAEDLADKTLALLGDPARADRLAQAARAHARNWAPERIVPNLLEAWTS